ncbi:hypothetical protein RJT34_26191 [Clitoria ternatea]|uniref:Uncharacterized protein n=1 Tax=Clitoria ternatea TaxID=43366 RepID=A0AAN9F6Y1_CLITE
MSVLPLQLLSAMVEVEWFSSWSYHTKLSIGMTRPVHFANCYSILNTCLSSELGDSWCNGILFVLIEEAVLNPSFLPFSEVSVPSFRSL